jgi:hypothetical protein
MTKNEPPKQAADRGVAVPLTHTPYPARAYLSRRITGDSASCRMPNVLSAPVSLSVPVTQPDCSLHGAANAISLLTAYYGPAKAICEISEDLATTPKPAGLPGCCAYACDSWRCDGGNLALDRGDLSFQEVLYNYYGLKSVRHAGTPTEQALRTEMAAGRPVIVKFGNGHSARWTAVIGAIPPLASAWRHEGLYGYQLADLSRGTTQTVGYGELRRHRAYGLATEAWIGIIPAGRCP